MRPVFEAGQETLRGGTLHDLAHDIPHGFYAYTPCWRALYRPLKEETI